MKLFKTKGEVNKYLRNKVLDLYSVQVTKDLFTGENLYMVDKYKQKRKYRTKWIYSANRRCKK